MGIGLGTEADRRLSSDIWRGREEWEQDRLVNSSFCLIESITSGRLASKLHIRVLFVEIIVSREEKPLFGYQETRLSEFKTTHKIKTHFAFLFKDILVCLKHEICSRKITKKKNIGGLKLHIKYVLIIYYMLYQE